VLQFLDRPGAVELPGAPLLVRTGCADDAVIEATMQLLGTVRRWEALPEFRTEPRLAMLPDPLRAELLAIAGRGAEADDAGLEAILGAACAGSERVLSRRARRRIEQALGGDGLQEITSLDPARWREQALAQAAAGAIASGAVGLEEAMRGLLLFSEATERLELADSADPGAILQLCPPARALLLRVADGCIEALGLNA
jgi:hypothetical protein